MGEQRKREDASSVESFYAPFGLTVLPLRRGRLDGLQTLQPPLTWEVVRTFTTQAPLRRVMLVAHPLHGGASMRSAVTFPVSCIECSACMRSRL